MQPEENPSKIAHWSRKILARLNEILPSKPVEADFRRVIDPLLDEFCAEVGLNPLAHVEYTLATGRADAVFNRFVIEYERPGTLKKSQDAATQHAVQQVKGYIEALAKRQRHAIERLAGVAFDGHFLIFVRFVSGRWSEEPPMEVNAHSLERFLTWLTGLSSGIALTSENLNRDFSIEQLRTQNVLRGLFQALSPALAQPDGLVAKLFEQWRLFFSEAIDYSEAFGGRKLEPLKKWGRKAGFEIKDAGEAERFFFALHTYFALLVKLLAWLAVSRHLGVRLGSPSFASLTTANGEALRNDLQKMERGGIFREYGILNLLEGDFFQWYLFAWNDKIEKALREIIKRLDEYDPTTLTIIPEETRDLFKKLYHYLLPREIRHNLGEYYTPDWLAQRLLIQVDGDLFDKTRRVHEVKLRQKVLQTRFLDPACGSGTFPVLIIARMIELGKMLLIPESELLESILTNVVGFDLNPLAVLTARVNVLLAIADLLQHRRKEVNIPIYLADSVRTPALGEELFSHNAYEFPSAVGTFLVPAVLCKREHFDRFCDLLEDNLRGEVDPDRLIEIIKAQFVGAYHVRAQLNCAPTPDRYAPTPPHDRTSTSADHPNPLEGWDDHAISLLRNLYTQLLDLHRRGLDGLWARLLKNNFAPLTVGQFDYVVGNPPWVNWENLPDGYRQAIAPLWARYEIFPHKGFDAILGKSKDDISVLMIYTVVDKLLKDNGRLGFVITQSVFKTGGGGQGFRRFRIPHTEEKPTPLAVIHVDDMVSLNPFEGASNRTAVMVLEKGKPTKYPVRYIVWRKKGRARFTYESTLEEVIAATKRLNFNAEPVDAKDETSPWLTARPHALRAVRKVLGRSDYEAHAGAYTGGANAVYWLEVVMKRPDGLVVVRNLTEGARIKVEEVTQAIEPDLLYPLLRGRDVQRWHAEPSAKILLTHEQGMRLKAITEGELQARYPRTYGYLKQFEPVLRKRSSRGVSDMLKKGAPFYTMFAVGDYTFAPWKVVWTRIARIEAAVIGTKDGKPVIPQETISLVQCQSEEEAHYIAALINSLLFQFTAISYSQEGGKSMGSMHILENIRISRYDLGNAVHRRLAELSERAHRVGAQWNCAPTKRGIEEELRKIEAEIDEQAAQLWGLSEAELRAIQHSLRELSGEEAALIDEI